MYPVHVVDSLYNKINKLVIDNHETRQTHITNCDVRTAIKCLRSENFHGSTDISLIIEID